MLCEGPVLLLAESSYSSESWQTNAVGCLDAVTGTTVHKLPELLQALSQCLCASGAYKNLKIALLGHTTGLLPFSHRFVSRKGSRRCYLEAAFKPGPCVGYTHTSQVLTCICPEKLLLSSSQNPCCGALCSNCPWGLERPFMPSWGIAVRGSPCCLLLRCTTK